jgi:hypothetical protein
MADSMNYILACVVVLMIVIQTSLITSAHLGILALAN